MNIYFAEPSLAKLSASHIYAWKLGLKTGQYYLRTRPARDAIQFTLDLEGLDTKNENQVSKNLTKAEMDEAKRHRKKRTAAEALGAKTITSTATDLTKKRKVSETIAAPVEKQQALEEADKKDSKVEKPWEKTEEAEVDYRWDICENCQ